MKKVLIAYSGWLLGCHQMGKIWTKMSQCVFKFCLEVVKGLRVSFKHLALHHVYMKRNMEANGLSKVWILM